MATYIYLQRWRPKAVGKPVKLLFSREEVRQSTASFAVRAELTHAFDDANRS